MSNKRKNVLDTPRQGAWCQQVNQPGFIPARSKPDTIRLKTITAQEYVELQPIFNGRG